MNEGRVCVGAHDLDNEFRSLRLLTSGGMNLRETDDIGPGEVWEVTYTDHPEPDPPHVEDVLVTTGKRVEKLSAQDVRERILANESPWRGSTEELFERTVAGTANGRLYVPSGGALPSRSTGYWISDAELVRYVSFDKAKFLYTGNSSLNDFVWVGMSVAPERIQAGTLVRMSLARYFSPGSAPAGYYVQISDVY
jgi:hypothetical protein